jgi:hypothetical protein
MRPTLRTALFAAVALTGSSLSSIAHACGGCFQPPDAVSTVTDHRMVIALSNTQTTLWDQIQYTGKPGDFVWVLPTPVPATVEIADQSFFDGLESATAPRVYPPPLSTGGGPQIGCGASGGSLAAAKSDGPGDDVTVFHQGSVGPYDTATVGSDDPMALINWLNKNGYDVPAAMKPTIAWYVQRKWVFNALRLKPDATTSQMTPVRVVFKGLAATFPLRMVAAGAGPSLGILLWIISDQRYMAGNYDTVEIDENALRWSTASNRSNYRELFAATLAAHPKGAFITEFAGAFERYSFTMAAQGDLATALVGQPQNPQLTRLRTDIAPTLLVQDLLLTPSPTNDPVANNHYLQASQQQSAPLGFLLGGQRSPMLAGLLLLALGLLRRHAARR